MTRFRRTFALGLCTLAFAAPSAHGEVVFYLSADPIGVATPPNPADTLQVQPGTAGTLNLFVMTDIRLAEIRLDILNVGNAIEFTSGHVIFQNSRWAFIGGPTVIQPDKIKDIGAGAIPFVSGNGVGPGSSDPGLDPTSGYLIATLGYSATQNRGATSELFMKIGTNFVTAWDDFYPALHLGGPNHALTPSNMIGATDSLLDFRIRVAPEPASIVLVGVASLSLAGFVRGRRDLAVNKAEH